MAQTVKLGCYYVITELSMCRTTLHYFTCVTNKSFTSGALFGNVK